MKYRLLDLLACPECGSSPLGLTTFESHPVQSSLANGKGCSTGCAAHPKAIGTSLPCPDCYGVEITQGLLDCPGCSKQYPVIDGIPRFNPDTFEEYPEFLQRYGSRLSKPVDPALAQFQNLHANTKKSFGFQWLRYKLGVGDQRDNRALFHRRTETEPGKLGANLFFEAGCGMGRYLKVIGEEPQAEVVGLDLSRAVNRAFEENKDNPRVHVVQGNILQMPFRPGVFDHTYSIGVLHHTPNTEQAFKSMAKLLKPGGRASIWLYHKWRIPEMQGAAALHASLKGWITDGLRVITTRLPHPLLHYLCYAAVPVGWVQLKIMNSPGPIKALLSPLLLVNCSVSPDWQVRVCDTFDWYSPQYQWKHTVPEVAGWFKELGFVDISTQGFPVSVRGTLPVGTSAAFLTSRGMDVCEKS